jgi:hypothetical protein
MDVGATDAGFFYTDLDVVWARVWFCALDHFQTRCRGWLKKCAHSGDYRSATLVVRNYQFGSNLRM